MTPTSLNTRHHEAGHAAMAHWLDVPVNAITVRHDGQAYGETRHAYCDITKQVMVILGGLLEYGGLPAWPVTQCELADEADLRDIIHTHRITEDTYRRLCLATLTIAADPNYQRLLHLTAAALRRQPSIDRDMFNDIAAIA